MEGDTLSELESLLESFSEPDMESPGEQEVDPLLGFIFDPTDEEIIRFLKHKRSHRDFYHHAFLEENIYDYEPFQIPGLPAIQADGIWWNFFCEPKRLKATSERFCRATRTGYWKATGDPSTIKAKGTHEEIGSKRTLVFHKRPTGSKEVKTNWIMHEYSASNNPQKDLVVCRIKEDKNKEGKKKRPSLIKDEIKQAKRSRISTSDDGQPSNFVSSDNENHVAEKPSPESQPLISCYLISNPAVENTYQELHYYSDSNFNSHAIEDTSQVDPLPLENLNVPNGSTRLHQTSFSTESPLLREEGPSSSSVFSDENEVLNSPIGSESQREDCLKWLLVTQDEFTGKETGHIGGFLSGDSGDVGSEIFNAMVDEAFWNNIS